MDVDWGGGVAEVFEAAGVVEVEVADDYGFDVFDIVACCCDCRGEFVFFGLGVLLLVCSYGRSGILETIGL